MTQLLSPGDLLALVDRAAPVVGIVQADSDAVAPGMLNRDAVVLLDQLSLRLVGMPAAALAEWQRRSGWRARPKQSLPELQQLAAAQANSRAAVQRRSNAFAARMRPVIREIQHTGVSTPGAIAQELNARGVPAAKAATWRRQSVENLLRRLAESPQ